ncbi:MAG: 5'-methylthioadenosine/adenosylhomocysteine nucleosidase [Treponema sp.]|nr:5'-methylthioadenosine/adenosylhomocysteine nucleosidase [Treponema sp.]
MKKIGIIGAMKNEISLLKEKIAGISEKKIAGMTFFSGKILGKNANVDVVLVKSGIGKVSAGICTQILCTVFNVDAIINTGIAGAICEDLQIFDIVLSKDAMFHDVDVTGFGYPLCQMPGMPLKFTASETLLKIAQENVEPCILNKVNGKCVNVFLGTIATGDQFINSNVAKKRIAENTQAKCCEMEGAAIAQGATMNNVPFLIIRCISDMSNDNGEKTYTFNEDKAAEICSSFVLQFLYAL